MTDIQTYLVGGAVRDAVLGLHVKDFDYTVVVPGASSIDEGWEAMRGYLNSRGYKIFLETPEYLTIRAKFPSGHPNEKVTADFVLARKDGPYSDGRRPDWVSPGTLEDDLSRRDFTVNALAENGDGSIIDLFGGLEDLKKNRLRAVGDAKERLLEDPLRVFRAYRFQVTKDLMPDLELLGAMMTIQILRKLENVISTERIKDELRRAFVHNPVRAMSVLVHEYPVLLGIAVRKGISFEPTMKDLK